MNPKIGLSLLLAGPLLAATPAYAESHALIMTIGAYTNGVKPLVGSRADIPNARAIANRMGIKNSNIRYYSDGQLTVAGMRGAFDDLYARVAENDQVFVYYSGHGGRARVSETDNRCAAALVAVDGEWVMDTDIQEQLARLAAKAQKVVMFADACHSGGIKTRNVPGQLPAGITPRFHARSGGDTCDTPTNFIASTLNARTRSIGQGGNNLVYIAAAREDEVSWDMGEAAGGAATKAWSECIMGAARDRDGSGGLSALEIQECAQQKMDESLKPFAKSGVLPSHVTIAGNGHSVLAFLDRPQTPTQAITAPAPVASKPPANATTTPPPAATGNSWFYNWFMSLFFPTRIAAPQGRSADGAPPSDVSAAMAKLPAAYHTLADIFNNRDDRRLIELKSAKPAFKIGADNVAFTLNATHPGYVYLLMVGSDGKTFDMLFPNKLDGNNSIRAGETLNLPRPNWGLTAGGPAGKNLLLAIVADAPRDFSSLAMQQAGPFSVVAANASNASNVQRATIASANAATTECRATENATTTRTLVVQQRCSNAYGAGMLVLEETD